ncbi:hypothetical protein Fcan01_13926 [Folsomia candida]|uniref:Uncharacterized protein n=1 Tax=Folsomia candida TaxID=158441 RepID=A0A226E1D8_FOLCA|nr:hypothetical protein Fcan01_13926 [Folsomia candida]
MDRINEKDEELEEVDQSTSKPSSPNGNNTIDVPHDDYISEHEVIEDAVRKFLAPLKKSILEANAKLGKPLAMRSRGDVPVSLLQSLCHFIWDINLIYTNPAYLNRLYFQLSLTFKMTAGQSDLNDLYDYKPAELVANKVSQLFILLVLPNPPLFLEELRNFAAILEDVRIARDVLAKSAYTFLFGVFRQLYVVLADVDEEYQDIVNVAPHHDYTMMTTHFDDLVVQFENSSAEWCLALAEIMRLRRREASARNKWPNAEEITNLQKAVSISPDNLFARLAVLDTIIGSVRDSSGRFTCGDIHLDNLDDSMKYLIDHSWKLTTDFPDNVTILSTISDYFARYVPHLFFDAERSLNLLQSANALNPSNPKTAHRFGILYRMSFGNLDDSLIWLSRAIQLDPTNFKATIEYYKTLLGKINEYPDVAIMMETTLEDTSISDGWNDYEMMDFLFLLGIAHFMKGDKEETLEVWEKCAGFGETVFSLEDVLTAMEHFQWPKKLVDVDKIKLWIQAEQTTLKKELQTENPPENLEKRKVFIDRLFELMLGYQAPKRPAPKLFFERKFPANLHGLFSFDP